VGGLVASASLASGGAGGAAFGAAATASADIVLWVVGQALDHQRLRQLRTSVEEACEPVHALTAAAGIILEEQRGDELDLLHKQMAYQTRNVNVLRGRSDQEYGAAIDAVETTADAYQALRITNPDDLAKALRKAHDQLVLAVRSNDGQTGALIVSLTALSQLVDKLETATNKLGSTSTAAGSKE
jgi:hypothetical protein